MAKRTSPLPPSAEKLMVLLGERIKLARLRRNLTATQVAERAGMTVNTLRSIERGGGGVTMAAYLSVLFVLGLENDINQLAMSDTQGRELQDAALLEPKKTVYKSSKAKPIKKPMPEKVCKSAEPGENKVVNAENNFDKAIYIPKTTKSLAALLKKNGGFENE